MVEAIVGKLCGKASSEGMLKTIREAACDADPALHKVDYVCPLATDFRTTLGVVR